VKVNGGSKVKVSGIQVQADIVTEVTMRVLSNAMLVFTIAERMRPELEARHRDVLVHGRPGIDSCTTQHVPTGRGIFPIDKPC
jgi:hypothetical protein